MHVACLSVRTDEPDDSVARICGAGAEEGCDTETLAPPLRRCRFGRFD